MVSQSTSLKAVKNNGCLATVVGTLILILICCLVHINSCVFCDVGTADLRKLILESGGLPGKSEKGLLRLGSLVPPRGQCGKMSDF